MKNLNQWKRDVFAHKDVEKMGELDEVIKTIKDRATDVNVIVEVENPNTVVNNVKTDTVKIVDVWEVNDPMDHCSSNISEEVSKDHEITRRY